MELQAGAQIDRYTLIQKLGEGGQGAVFRAEDRLQPGRSVALKLVPLAVAAAAQVERVRREARHLARLNHPGLPACHGLFEDLQHGLLVVAMEFVEGSTLNEARVWLDEGQRVAVLRHMASVLAFLHGSGVVHRDVKLDNVIVSPQFRANPAQPGTVKLIDLGISVASGNPQPLTVVGHIIGTPSYLAPEILDPHYFPGLQDTPAADVFAFGVLGWSLLFGEHPAGLGDNASMASYALAYRQADQVASWPPPGRGGPWEQLLRRCLAVRARERFTSAADLLAALSALDVGGPPASLPAAPPPAAPPGAPLATPLPVAPLQATSPPADAPPFTAPPADAHERRSSLPATRVEPIALSTAPPPAAPSAPFAPAAPQAAPLAPPAAPVAPPITAPMAPAAFGASVSPATAAPATPPMGPAPSTFAVSSAPSAFAVSPASTAPMGGQPITAPGAPLGHTPAAATVSAAPLPASFLDEPSRASTVPSAPLPALPTPPLAPIPTPAAPAPAVAPAPSRFARRMPGPLEPRAQQLPVLARHSDALASPKPKTSIFRVLLAAFLIFAGGAAAFVLAIIIFILVNLR